MISPRTEDSLPETDMAMIVSAGKPGAGGIRGLRAGANVALDNAASDGAVAIAVPDAGIETVVQNYITNADITCVSLVCTGPTSFTMRTDGDDLLLRPRPPREHVIAVRPSDVMHTAGQMKADCHPQAMRWWAPPSTHSDNSLATCGRFGHRRIGHLADRICGVCTRSTTGCRLSEWSLLNVVPSTRRPVLRYAASKTHHHRGEMGVMIWGLPDCPDGGFDLAMTLPQAVVRRVSTRTAVWTLLCAVGAAHTLRVRVDAADHRSYLGSLHVPQAAVRAKLTFGFTVKRSAFPSSIFSTRPPLVPFGRQPDVPPCQNNAAPGLPSEQIGGLLPYLYFPGRQPGLGGDRHGGV